MRLSFVPALALSLALFAAPAAADADQERARRAVAAGEARPLSEILERVKDRLPGEVVAVELEREAGVWVYEFKVLDAEGRRVDVYVDAGSAEILKTKPAGRAKGRSR